MTDKLTYEGVVDAVAEEILRAKDAGRQRGKGLFNLLRNDVPEHVHDALVEGMIETMVELRKERARKELELLPKKTYRVWANQPFWCEVQAPNEEEAKRIAAEEGYWDACEHKWVPPLEDIYDVEEINEDGDTVEEIDAEREV